MCNKVQQMIYLFLNTIESVFNDIICKWRSFEDLYTVCASEYLLIQQYLVVRKLLQR